MDGMDGGMEPNLWIDDAPLHMRNDPVAFLSGDIPVSWKESKKGGYIYETVNWP